MSVEVFQPSNQTQPYWAGGIGWSNPNVFAWLGGTHSTDRVETICDCVSIIACWCDGVTECPPCASSGNRPHICATAEQRAEYQPTEPDSREAD